MRYGLYDTVDECWIGDSKGPTLYDDATDAPETIPARTLAEIAAQIVDERLRQGIGRTRARPFDEQPMRVKDTKETRFGTLEAIRRIEGVHDGEDG